VIDRWALKTFHVGTPIVELLKEIETLDLHPFVAKAIKLGGFAVYPRVD
jgi:hypothetical protein